MLVRAPKRVNVGTHTRSTVVTRPRAAPTRTVNGMWRSSAPNTFVPRRFASQKPDLPVSPHVTIYRQPLPAMTSITHRITGVALFAGIIKYISFSMLFMTRFANLRIFFFFQCSIRISWS